MAISVEQINLWRQLDSETERLEFKEAKTQFDYKDLCQYCVAIGNEGGGHLLFGIKNQPPRMLVNSKAANNPLAMANKLLQTLKFRVDVEAVAHTDGRVVVFTIPPRPRGSAFHLEGAYWMRSGEALVPMTEDQLRRIHREGEPDWLDEPSISRIGGALVLELLDAPALFELLHLPYPSTVGTIMDRMVSERLIEDDGGGAYTIRRLGALLLAKDVNTFPDVSRKAPRVVVYKGTAKLANPIAHVIGTRGYAVGFSGLLKFVNQHLPHEEIIGEDGLRRDVQLIPSIIVRELLANALVHQDINITGSSVVVEIFSDRLEISNPGEPVVPIDRLIDGYRSRNERLADVMRRMGVCEERGSGIDKVVDAVESSHLPAPDFRAMQGRTLFIVYGPRDFSGMDRADRIRACYQHCALKWEMSQHMTNQSLRERFKISESQSHLVTQVILSSIEAGVIKPDEKVGTSRKYARYVPFWV